jgi:hypothetical protein
MLGQYDSNGDPFAVIRVAISPPKTAIRAVSSEIDTGTREEKSFEKDLVHRIEPFGSEDGRVL